MRTRICKFSLLLPLLLIFLSGSAYSIANPSFAEFHESSGSIRSILASKNKSDPVVDCAGMLTKSQCSAKLKCRWCRSTAVDDMCFSKLEARRLPSQVFACD